MTKWLGVAIVVLVLGCEQGSDDGAEGEIVAAQCDQIADSDLFAVAKFPGRTVDELARVQIVATIPNEQQAERFAGTGVTHALTGPSFVGDGVAVRLCGTPDAPTFRGELLFILNH